MSDKETSIHDAIKEYQENYDYGWDYYRGFEFKKVHPIIAKLLLSREIVERFHGKEAARKSFDEWIYEFNNRIPFEIEEKTIWHFEDFINIKNLLKGSGLINSTSEALRLIKQKGVKIDGITIEHSDMKILSDNIYRTYQCGKKRFMKIRVSQSKGYL